MGPLAAKIRRVRENLRSCTLCPWLCRVDRLAGEEGYCGLGAEGRVFHHYLSQSEEESISPTYEILLSGCSHRCRFCTVLEQVEEPQRTPACSIEEIRAGLRGAELEGMRTLSFVGGEPTVNLLAALELLDALAPSQPIVWNSNMFMTPFVHEILEDVVDVFVGDFHFGSDRCAREVGGVFPYVEPIRGSFERAARKARVVIRHLALPGHVDCCLEPVTRWARERLPQAELHVMEGFLPRSDASGSLGRALSPTEIQAARDLASGPRSLPVLPGASA